MEPRLDSEAWREVVNRLGGEAELARSAVEQKALVRSRGVRSPTDLLWLALTYGPGGHSLRTTAALAAMAGVADISDVALMKRIAGAADWLSCLCAKQLGKVPNSQGNAPKLRLLDASRLEGPGKVCFRLHACYDPVAGRICDLDVTSMEVGEHLDALPPKAGELRIADRGYPDADSILATRTAGADVLVRLTWNSLRLIGKDDERVDWLALFKTANDNGHLDIDIRIAKPRGSFEPLPMRLVIVPKTPVGTVKAKCKVRREGIKDQRRKVDPRTIAAAGYLILITSLDRNAFSLARLTNLYRVRWQIELAFKRLKSILNIDRLPAKCAPLARAWLLAHLLLALLADDLRAELAAIPP
jgi:Transposase DDE domain